MEFLIAVLVCLTVVIFSGVVSFSVLFGLIALVMRFIEKKIDKEDNKE